MMEPQLPALTTSPKSLPVPEIVSQAGASAAYAWDEFFAATIRNKHTRLAYLRAVTRFLKWIECPLVAVTAGMIARYLDQLPISTPSRKLELAALRRFFDHMTVRHVVVVNPASSVRGERHSVTEGSTPEITTMESDHLLRSIPPNTIVNRRDRAILACLMFTAARAGAVASLTRGSLLHDGSQYRFRFAEKNGKRHEVPLRHDLTLILLDYLKASGLDAAPPNMPLFPTSRAKLDRLSTKGMTGGDICRMMKRRLSKAGLPASLSPHSFRVSVTTDLLNQKIPLEDVQTLLGHADPRTTRLYDRRQRVVTRNLVEKITSSLPDQSP